jgi:hypothetical protein
MPRQVREPIQVYLTEEERARLDASARELGVSRSEVLRRGIASVHGPSYHGALRDLAESGVLTPAKVAPGTPPPRRPVAPLAEVLAGLERDRSER